MESQTPQPLTSTFHTSSCQNPYNAISSGTLTYTDYLQQTLCIMLQVRIHNKVIFSSPLVLPVAVTAAQLKDDLNFVKVELKRMLQGKMNEHAGMAKMEVEWNHDTASITMRSIVFEEGNAGALLRYLKQRGGVDTIVVSW